MDLIILFYDILSPLLITISVGLLVRIKKDWKYWLALTILFLGLWFSQIYLVDWIRNFDTYKMHR